jgi:hypothetical protein
MHRRYFLFSCLPAASLFLLLIFSSGCSDDKIAGPEDWDPTAPFPITDLALTVNDTIALLTWTATGDNGPNGTADRYDLRQFQISPTEENWEEGTRVSGLPAPGKAGTSETFDLPTPNLEDTYFLALKVWDDSGNASKISNVVFVDLLPPAPISDLAPDRLSDTFTAIRWTTPEDNGPLGRPSRYEIRISQELLTVDNWDDERPRNGPAGAADAGLTEKFTLTPLVPESHYFVAVRSRDASGNLSDLSNVLEFDTKSTPLGWSSQFGDLPINGAITTFCSVGDTLYLGGPFSHIGGISVMGIAKFDGVGFSDLAGGLAGGQYGPRAMAITPIDGALYVGGSFLYAGGQPAGNLAKWTGSGWEVIETGMREWAITSLCQFDGGLLLGGNFWRDAGQPHNFLARFDGSDFHSMGFGDGIGGPIASLTVYNGKLVVGGGFDRLDGNINAASVAFWDGFGYSWPEPPLVKGNGTYPPWITAFCEFQGDLIVAGDFTSAGVKSLNRIARWDGSSWHPLGSGVSGGDWVQVSAVAVHEGYLVVGGIFEYAGGLPVNNIALWDGQYWEPMGGGILSDSSGAPVAAITSHQGSIFVGGTFSAAGGVPSKNLARWDFD